MANPYRVYDDGHIAARTALQGDAAIKAGYPQCFVKRTDPDLIAKYGVWTSDQSIVSETNKRMEDAGTGRRCNMCKCVRMFLLPTKDSDEHWRTDANDKHRIKWAFIPEGKKLCIECSEKQNAKRAAERLAKAQAAAGEAPSAKSKPNQVTLLQQLVTLMQEQADREKEREERERERAQLEEERYQAVCGKMDELIETNCQLVAENEHLNEQVILMKSELTAIYTEVQSLNDTQDKVQYALQRKANITFDEFDVFDAEKHDDTYVFDEGPGKYLDDTDSE